MSLRDFAFKKGQGGRQSGSKNRITGNLLEAFSAEGDVQSIRKVLRITKVEKPDVFLKYYVQLVGFMMPKAIEITETKLMEVSDDELTAYIEFARGRLASRRELIAGSTGSGEEPTLN